MLSTEVAELTRFGGGIITFSSHSTIVWVEMCKCRCAIAIVWNPGLMDMVGYGKDEEQPLSVDREENGSLPYGPLYAAGKPQKST